MFFLGYSYSQAFAINASGQVVGESFNAQATRIHGFLWSLLYHMQDLGELPGGSPRVIAQAINRSTQVVGQAVDPAGIGHAFLWTPSSGMQDLGKLRGFDSAYAFAINDSGQVVGYAYNHSVGGCPASAFLWTRSTGMRDLGHVPGSSCGMAASINNSGQVTGTDMVPGQGDHAFLWTSSAGIQDLGVVFPGGITEAWAINDSGQIAGIGDTRNSTCGNLFLWTSSAGWQDLGTLSGGNCSGANGINSSGEVVGYSNDFAQVNRAVRWTQATGVQDLNSLLTKTGKAVISTAWGINAAGKIVGTKQLGQLFHAVLLTPVSK